MMCKEEYLTERTKSKMNKIRRFTKEDWYTYAGCENFSKDQPPLIAEIELQHNSEIIILADKNGIEIDLSGQGECGDWGVDGYHKDIENLTAMRAEGELRALIKALAGYELACDVAYELDHPSCEATKGFQSVGTLL